MLVPLGLLMEGTAPESSLDDRGNSSFIRERKPRPHGRGYGADPSTQQHARLPVWPFLLTKNDMVPAQWVASVDHANLGPGLRPTSLLLNL